MSVNGRFIYAIIYICYVVHMNSPPIHPFADELHAKSGPRVDHGDEEVEIGISK